MDNAPIRDINTVFRGLYVGGDIRNTQKNYAREAKDHLMASYIVNTNSQRGRQGLKAQE